MANPRHESHALTGVGPPAPMQRQHPTAYLNSLPVEVLHIIITQLDDLPFAWSELRQVSPFWRAVTENFFQLSVLQTCSVSFTGQTMRELSSIKSQSDTIITNLGQPRRSGTKPTFRFRPSGFVPPESKTQLVFRLHDLPVGHETVLTPADQASEASSSDRLAQIFFRQGTDADLLRCRLSQEIHFIYFFGELRNIRLPNLMINIAAREVLVDWRQLVNRLCQDRIKSRWHP
ncbi:hypothetical protein NX059_001444 [Plenodomus lindquistii]|nr:hypothetical protein NX059_001444 [Plenodomus lindquistii]